MVIVAKQFGFVSFVIDEGRSFDVGHTHNLIVYFSMNKTKGEKKSRVFCITFNG